MNTKQDKAFDPAEGSGRADSPRFYTDSLHNNESRRLDARLVAELFGLKVSELARYIDLNEKAVLSAPDSKLAHEKLLPYEQIAGALNLMEGDTSKFQRWLNSPNDELSGQTPMKLLREGKAEDLAGLVQAVLLGQPA